SGKPGAQKVSRSVLTPPYGKPDALEAGLKAEMPRLLAAARADDPGFVATVLTIIRAIDAEAPQTATLVLDLLGSPNPKIRATAPGPRRARRLVGDQTAPPVAVGAQKALPLLIRLLADEDKYVVWGAVRRLRPFGAAAKDAVPALCKVLASGRFAEGDLEKE